MNVRLSYGVELSEVPAKVAEMLDAPDRILSKNRNKLDLVVELLHESEGKYAGVASEMIDDLRKELAILDQQLMEAAQILAGYAEATAPVPAPVAPPQQQAQPAPQASRRLDDIPRGPSAVSYPDPIDEAMDMISRASGDLPTLEDNDV
jgi:hypothetical protein